MSKTGSGSGSVSSSPAGINCGATCSASFSTGSQVTLTATSDAGSTFAGWSGDCTGTGTCQVTMDQARAVTATFNAAAPVSNTPPVIGGPGSVRAGDLFCGVQHRGHCNGLKIKTEFASPGNAVWQFAAYNPSPGHATARGAAKKVVVLGTLKRQLTKAGRLTIVFKLKPSARTKRLYRQVLKLHLKTIRVKLTFTTPSGQHLIVKKNVKLRR